MGEQAVEADGDPEPGDHVEHHGDHQVGQVDGVAPQQRDEHGQGHRRTGHDGHGDQLLGGADVGLLLTTGRGGGVGGTHRLMGDRQRSHGTSHG